MDIIYGRNAVKAAIRSGRSIDKLIASKDLTDPSVREILTLATQHHIPIVRADRRKLDSMTLPYGFNGKPANHQGVVAVTPARDYDSMDDIFALAEQRGEPPFIVLLDGITDEGNFGSIIRSAEVLGAHGVVLGKRRSASLSAVAAKSSSGAADLIPIVKVTNLVATIKELKQKNIWTVAADPEGQDAHAVDMKGAIALVIGSEGEGISRLVLEHCDFKARIPMKGQTGSLNAAVAAAVLMYEKIRQENTK
ncbi:MAG: 23S rRNA (guanosine(2251)-2'-O)-methyltransferase RlmB [Christensenellaceae bacterium]|nr:23S rRNA (guanosine(2251)-2'-O)-methyltransferase RlmB [Christensenellaceae bacterium]